MFFKKKPNSFYYPGLEISLEETNQYHCLDGATLKAVQTARRRMFFLIFIFVCAFLIIAGKLFWITVVQYESRVFDPEQFKQKFSLKRQDILDRNGFLLATSLPTVHLAVVKSKIKDIPDAARMLSKSFPDLSYSRLIHEMGLSNVRIIKRNLTPKERMKVYQMGLYFVEEEIGEKRAYLQGPLFSHILGLVNVDGLGVSGLELMFNAVIPEAAVQTSLDLPVQEMVYETLSEGIERYHAIGGLALVMDVRNAEILAAVSLPDFNPNLPVDPGDADLFNKITTGVYEFGSVFKLFNTAMALEYGDIQPTDKFDVSEPIKIGRKVITDYRGPERVISVPEVLIHSSNIGTVKIAQRSGWQKQKEFLTQFHFFKRLPTFLPERAVPLYPKEKKWADITSANIAFGYGISITPLHLIAGVAALVNGGIYRSPVFVKGANDGQIEHQVLSEKNSEIMRQMMWAVVNWDSKPDSIESLYAVGGKTGSANLLDKGKYQPGRLRTTFVGVFPMNNPKYAILITLEDPKKIKETFMFNTAGWNAKKIGIDLIAKIAPYLGVEPVHGWKHPSYIDHAIESSLSHKKR